MGWGWIGGAAGGIGMFLLGVRLMTEGLKVAAGRALGRALRRATASRLRALATGLGLTALVQSSSAVTVATIGFVNAGLLGLGEALWVIYGSNVGTSATGWLVALTGVDLNVEAYALPLIGFGALARALDRRRRIGALGEALAGLGLFFLGLSILGESFTHLGELFDLSEWGGGLGAQLSLFLVGALLTIAMQSSSAAIAVTLSAAASGVIDLTGAGAMVIGANLGTTSTALLAVIGATPAARRTAAGHVAFNVLAAAVALALLPWLLDLLRLALGGQAAIASTLAAFHTVFNLLGLLLVWPLANRIERTLAGRWVTPEEERAIPRYLDRNVLAVSEVGVEAIARETARLGRHAGDVVARALAEGRVDEALLGRLVDAYEGLGSAISGYANELAGNTFSEESAAHLTRLLRARRHYDAAVEQARVVAGLRGELAEEAPTMARLDDPLAESLREVATASNPEAEGFSVERGAEAAGRMQERYDARRKALLKEATGGTLRVREAVAAQHLLGECRRAVRQLLRGGADLVG